LEATPEVRKSEQLVKNQFTKMFKNQFAKMQKRFILGVLKTTLTLYVLIGFVGKIVWSPSFNEL